MSDDVSTILRQKNVTRRLLSETVSEDEHFREIKAVGLEKLGERIGVASYSTSLAIFGSGLGLDSLIRNVEFHPKPYTELLTQWNFRSGSTVRVMRHLLCEMGRDDCVQLLDHLRTRPVHLNIRVNYKEKSFDLHSVDHCDIPGRRSLSDHVRPYLVQLLQAIPGFKSSDPVRVQMKSIGSLVWYSSAEEFQGQQVDIYIDKMDLNTIPQRNTAPAGGATSQPEKTFERNVTRNASSECNVFDFFFEIVREPPPVIFAGENLTVPGSNVRPDIILPKSQLTPLARSDSLQFENETHGLVGFHDMLGVPAEDTRNAAEELLSNYIAQDGCYLIHPCEAELACSISVTYNSEIVHLGVMYNHQSHQYYLFLDSAIDTSLEALINYYQRHDIDRLPGLRLTNPIS